MNHKSQAKVLSQHSVTLQAKSVRNVTPVRTVFASAKVHVIEMCPEMPPKIVPKIIVLAITLLVIHIELATTANILVLCPICPRSHKNVIEPVARELVRNHTLTMVSSFSSSIQSPNFRDIIVMDGFDYYKNTNTLKVRERGLAGGFEDTIMEVVQEGCHTTYRNQEFIQLLSQKWDLVILNAFDNHCMQGFAYKTRAPVVWFMPLPTPGAFSIKLGNYLPPSFVPDVFLPFGEAMNLWERIQNFVLPIYMYNLYFSNYPEFENTYRHHLQDESIPGLAELESNVSLMLVNTHFAVNHPRPTMPEVVEIGGVHCRPGKPLPLELDKFISEAQHGVVLFSLGSIFKAKDMPEETRKAFLGAFSKLKQKVLWKWDLGEMKDLPANVKLSKWLPLQDVLAHPNVKVFITHGGLLSTQEAIYHGVPLVGIPLVADQDLNINRYVKSGFAVSLEIIGLREENVTNAVNTILNDSSYKEKIQGLSKIFRDQPQSALERAVFWTEYVLRHKGAPQLRSIARELNFLQYHSLDVIVILMILVFTVLFSVIYFIRLCYRRFLADDYKGKVAVLNKKKL